MNDASAEGGRGIEEHIERFLLVKSVREYAIVMLDREGNVVTWNEGARLMTQYDADEIVGRHFSLFYSEEDRATAKPRQELEIAARVGVYEEQGWRHRKDGSRFWASVVVTPLRGAGGRLDGFCKISRDLSERRQTEEQLRLSEQRLRLLVDGICDYAVFMLDPTGHVATWNEGARRTKQYTAAEIIGRHFSIFYPLDDVRAGKCERELAIAAAEGRFEEESWRVRKDGSRFWANVVISAMRDSTGQLVGFAKVTRDLTERRQANEERLRLARAEEAVRMRDEFLSIASHELKTPLTSVQLRLSGIQRLVKKGLPDADGFRKLVERVDAIEGQLDCLAQLVESLLDVSRVVSGQLRLELGPVDAARLVRDVVKRFEYDLAERGQVRLELQEELIGQWDGKRMEQVVTNILSNAIKYGAGKPIEVRLQRRDGDAVLEVRDHGIGIAAEDQERIFERFARAVPITHYGGLGLGLWIVRLIVESLGGRIGVESEPGSGANFVVTLPLAKTGAQRGEQRRA